MRKTTENKDDRLKLKLIERLFRKKEPILSEIGFNELPVWLERRLEELSDEPGRHASSLYSDIEYAIRDIKRSTSSLEEAEPEGRFHLKVVKLATSNRDNMIKQVNLLINNITIPKATDIKTILRFHENAMQNLTVCLENMMKSYQYTKLVFLEDSKQVIADVNALGRLLNRLIEPINENKKVLDAIESASKAVQAIKEMRSTIESEESSIKEKEEKAALLVKESEEKQKALIQLKDSEQWKQYLNCMNEISVLENNTKKIESDIVGLVLPLNKALNRLKQLTESGKYTLSPQIKEELFLCLSDPKCVNPEFFIEFRSIIESDALNLGQERRDKMLEQLRLVSSSFDSYKKQYQVLMQDIEKRKDDISKMNTAQEEANLRDRIKVLQDELTASGKELEASKKYLDALMRNIELKKQELQQSVSIIDSRVQVLF